MKERTRRNPVEKGEKYKKEKKESGEGGGGDSRPGSVMLRRRGVGSSPKLIRSPFISLFITL